ncbi:type 1 glutamine amidotransferase [Luteibacter yeojuensis]|uniref:Glutamine amidotransferase n=1 Tax=Luteibacter yeojuensis TaxID=345309 RepID=A0A0F3KVK8_9GAMM|nr:type 1 glutamine amidotransferase [Luteibacter yeojuensis]KJV35248.1 glutamine amidotransferase [Luteibacter yeojuensis]
MNIHFIIHEAFEAPGAFEAWARDRGQTVSRSRVYAGESLPEGVGDIDLLVVFGGPQSPATTLAECPHFDARAEMALINLAIAAGKAVVGVCLGAQLIGEALGASHARSPEPEIGSFPIALTRDGRTNPKFAALGDGLAVGHWHGDMPGLTPGATVIAVSEGCPRQIVEYTPLVYGFQCHMEFTRDVVEGLIAASTDELRRLAGRPFVQPPDVLRASSYGAMNEALFAFLDALVSDYIGHKTAIPA